jgi:hypothetical protein
VMSGQPKRRPMQTRAWSERSRIIGLTSARHAGWPQKGRQYTSLGLRNSSPGLCGAASA